MHYTLKDHQGNLTATVCGNTVERLSCDAWGRRRNPNGFGYDNVSHTFDRGYTLHEHYDDFGLINMNGRLYDPVLGRMLSPDIAIQDQYFGQAYNCYSYCLNNPLRFTDPSGYVVENPPYYFMLLNPDKILLKYYYGVEPSTVEYNTNESEGTQRINVKWKYDGDPFGRMRLMETGNGTQWRFYYSLTDHLGNVRAEFAVHDSGQPELVQQADYYPFGFTLRRDDYGSQLPNRRLYGGKELQDETLAGNTLDWYDFEARMYDPLIGRFHTTDPMAEKYFSMTPYGYCGNNPIKYVDPTGNDLEISIDNEKKTISVRANFYYNSSQLAQGYDFNTIKKGFQNAMNTWSENIKTAFDNMQFEGFSVNVQFEWKEVDIKDATGVKAINIIEAAAEADPIGNSIVHVEKTNPRSEVKGTKHLVANMEKAAADPYMFFGIDGYDGNTAMHEIGHFFGLRDRYDPTNSQHASYIEGDLMSDDMPNRRNAVEPFKRIIEYNNLTPGTSGTILINKDNREPK